MIRQDGRQVITPRHLDGANHRIHRSILPHRTNSSIKVNELLTDHVITTV